MIATATVRAMVITTVNFGECIARTIQISSAKLENGRPVTTMAEYSNDMLLGSAIQLIKDLHNISFLGDQQTCTKIYYMTKDWLKLLEVRKDG